MHHVLEILLATTVKAAPKSKSAAILRALLQKSHVVDDNHTVAYACRRYLLLLEWAV